MGNWWSARRWDGKRMLSRRNVFALVHAFVKAHRLGVVNGAQGSFQIFPDDPKKVRIPDVSFARWERTPEGGVEEGHGKIAPNLVVEVISPNDFAVEVGVKVRDFLNAGVSLIWVANPDTNDVLVYRADGTVALLRSGDVLDGGDVLPGFQCPSFRPVQALNRLANSLSAGFGGDGQRGHLDGEPGVAGDGGEDARGQREGVLQALAGQDWDHRS